jgi:hypothetical protein
MAAYYERKINEFKLTPEEQKDLKFIDEEEDEEKMRELENEEVEEEIYEHEEEEEGVEGVEGTEAVEAVEAVEAIKEINEPTENEEENRLLNENEGNVNAIHRDDIEVYDQVDDIQVEDLNEESPFEEKYFQDTETKNVNVINKTENMKTSFEKEPRDIGHLLSKYETRKSKLKEKKKETALR